MPMRLLFDIETGPLPPEELALMIKPFDPSEVKVGNIKDEEKIAAKIEEERKKHEQAQLDNASLDPLTGRVLAIGILYPHDNFHLIEGDEKEILLEFWCRCSVLHTHIGFNIYNFDLPFLIRRSWRHGVKVPSFVRNGRYWNSDRFIDLRDIWTMGDKFARGSLDSVSRHLGLTPKTGSGKDFARLWTEDRPKAIEYLQDDLMRTKYIGEVILNAELSGNNL